MFNMWSDKRNVNLVVNIMLFLAAMNFVHLGQLILPLICIVIFIDSKYVFKVNNIVTFVILCLFATMFCAFSYNLGFYCVMGFCLPMAYYIGSNIKYPSEENIKKIFYIVVLGMSVHILLNFGFDLYKYGIEMFRKNNHYDFWTRNIMQQALLSSDCLLISSCLYYLIQYEKSKKVKIIGISLVTLVTIYNVGLGRRTPLFVVILAFILSVFADLFVFKNSNFNKKILLKTFGIVFAVLAIILIIFFFNLFDLQYIMTRTTIYEKFLHDGFSFGRLELVIESLPYLPQYLWGGRHISSVLEELIHNLWLDIYDYAGIVPFVLIVIYTIQYIMVSIRLFNNKKTSNGLKMLKLEEYFVVAVLMLVEPAMTGLSIFIICAIIMQSATEKYLAN